jgi:hypothetical protein
MNEKPGFLSRWSQRKLAARDASKATQKSDVTPAPLVGAQSDPGAHQICKASALPEPPEGEIVGLPSVADIIAETDVSVFLPKEVPEALRNAALRRAWLLDPKIRDYVCEAREYAYDWNKPDGIPGNAPLLPNDIARTIADGLFSQRSTEIEQSNDDRQQQVMAQSEEITKEQAGSPVECNSTQENSSLANGDREVHPICSVGQTEADEVPAEAREQDTKPTSDHSDMIGRRRHGSAAPV